MSGHTRGPWVVGETLRADALAVIGDGDSVVCEFPDRLGASLDADARLIAAAPALLEAAQYAENLLLRYEINRVDGDAIAESALAVIRAAIRQATEGEGND